jgi:hypothetical protein
MHLTLLKRVFLIQQYTTDSCKYSAYPIILTKIVDCSYLHGSNMAFRREIFRKLSLFLWQTAGLLLLSITEKVWRYIRKQPLTFKILCAITKRG